MYPILNNPESLPWYCTGSKSVDKDHEHIVTGDLHVIFNIKLRKTFCKAPKFKESKYIHFEKSKTYIVEGIDDSSNTISKMSLLEWKSTIIKQTYNKIAQLKIKSTFSKASPNSLGNYITRKTLADLHQNCIVVPVEEANKNVAIIGKIFYALTLMKELGVTIVNCNNNNTYEMINIINVNGIIDKRTRIDIGYV